MTKRTWFVAPFALLALVLLSCIPIENGGPGVPTNLTLAAGSDGASVELSWNAPTETVDGYNIYFSTTSSGAGTKIGSTTTALTYTDATPTSAGYYWVTSYTGTDESDKSSVVDDMPVEGSTTNPVYEYKGSGASGFGWSNAGVGSNYYIANKDLADIFLYGGESSPGWDPMWIASGSENPWDGARTTGIADQGSGAFTDFTLAPETGAGSYYSSADAVIGHVYFLSTIDNYFVKIRVSAIGGTYPDRYISFQYAFQKLAPNFRLF